MANTLWIYAHVSYSYNSNIKIFLWSGCWLTHCTRTYIRTYVHVCVCKHASPPKVSKSEYTSKAFKLSMHMYVCIYTHTYIHTLRLKADQKHTHVKTTYKYFGSQNTNLSKNFCHCVEKIKKIETTHHRPGCSLCNLSASSPIRMELGLPLESLSFSCSQRRRYQNRFPLGQSARVLTSSRVPSTDQTVQPLMQLDY